jgi:hypothetical protein
LNIDELICSVKKIINKKIKKEKREEVQNLRVEQMKLDRAKQKNKPSGTKKSF